MDAELVNVSRGGLGVLTRDSLRVGEGVSLKFALPGRKHVLRAQATVAWQAPSGYVGLRFDKLASASDGELQLWLASRYFEG